MKLLKYGMQFSTGLDTPASIFKMLEVLPVATTLILLAFQMEGACSIFRHIKIVVFSITALLSLLTFLLVKNIA